ncbi:unnamed protein product [Symbiodinium sp. CCMP2592]|nr:unnamed protein product [Symbiodinium sp. CCMP2592]
MQLPDSELTYRGRQEQSAASSSESWKGHSVGCRGFFAILLWLLRNKSLANECKRLALKLFLGMACLCIAAAADEETVFMAMLVDRQGSLKQSQLSFEGHRLVCAGAWSSLLASCPGGSDIWSKLSRCTWMGRCITSPAEAATLEDFLFYLAWLFCHPKSQKRGQNLFSCMALCTLPRVLSVLGGRLMLFAKQLAKQELDVLPVMKTKNDVARKQSDPVNRMILMYRLRREKMRRRQVARTHEDLSLSTVRFMQYEAFLDCLLHYNSVKHVFSQERQLCIAWDPSSYGGKEVLVGAVYSRRLDKAAWLLNQELRPVMLGDIDETLLPLAKQAKLKRVAGYNELRGLSASLRTLGLSLLDFLIPDGLIARPLAANEFRLQGPDGRWWVHDESAGTTVPQIPASLRNQLDRVPILLSVSDQGPVNVSALNFLQYGSPVCIDSQFDTFHRAWNDIKASLKRSVYKGWRTVLVLTVVANLPYGPYSSSQFFFRKKAKLEEFLATRTSDCDSWQRYVGLISREQRVQEPRTKDANEAMFTSLRDMPSFQTKGPLVKLLRWFSFFESMTFLSGQFWATKMVLQESMAGHAESEESGDETMPNAKDPATGAIMFSSFFLLAKELQELKKKKGSWRLAGQAITELNLCIKDCILSVGKASWKFHAERARAIKSPMQVLSHNVACASSRFWALELEEMLESSLWDASMLQHVLPRFQGHEKALHIQARKLALEHWRCLLDAEAAESQGAVVGPLAVMHWRHSALMRILLMAFEDDDRSKSRSGPGQAAGLLMVLSKHLGDSRLVEQAHQTAKDLFRSNKNVSFSNTGIMSKILTSDVLEKRGMTVVKTSMADKVTAPAPGKAGHVSSVTGLMKASTHKLPKSMQELMVPRKKKDEWPSPTPAALFDSAAATAWLMHYWPQKDAGSWPETVNVNSAWLSVLALPGSCLAQQSTSSLVKVVAATEYAFLAWEFSVQKLPDGDTCYCLRPDRRCLKWRHIVDLDDWAFVPTEPVLLNQTLGPIGWKKSGESMSLQCAVCLAGLPLTVVQMRDLVKLLGGHVKGNASRKTVEEHVWGLSFPEDELEAAKAAAKPNVEEHDNDWDSELSEVISELDQDDANKQDLQEMKARKKKAKLLMKMDAKQHDQPIPTRGKAKGRGKGRGKGKGKGNRKKDEKTTTKKRGRLDDSSFASRTFKRRRLASEPAAAPPASEPPGGGVDCEEAVPAQPVDPEPAVPEPAEPSSSSRPAAAAGDGERAPVVRVNRSPEDILMKITPPGAWLGLSYGDHRFTSKYEVAADKAAVLEGTQFVQRTMDRSFRTIRTWEEALSQVHEFNWTKWQLLKHHGGKFALPAGAEEQEPGRIPPDVLDALRSVVEKMPPPKTRAA